MSAFLISMGTTILLCAAATGLMGGDKNLIGPSLLGGASLIGLGLLFS